MLVKQMATIGELLTTAAADVFHDILTHWSPGYLNDILDKPFQSNFNEWWLRCVGLKVAKLFSNWT